MQVQQEIAPPHAAQESNGAILSNIYKFLTQNLNWTNSNLLYQCAKQDLNLLEVVLQSQPKVKQDVAQTYEGLAGKALPYIGPVRDGATIVVLKDIY